MKKFVNTIRKLDLLHKLRSGTLDKTFIFAVSAILFVFSNIIMQAVSLKADLSNGKAYTLSPSTKKLLTSLDDVLNVKFYVSSDLPTRLIPLKTEVTDLLNEFKKESGNKVAVKIADPKQDTASQKDVELLGIPELQFSQLEKDKYQLSTAYFGLGISYGSKKEALPQATDLGNLEYNITSLIYRLTRKELDKVAIAGPPPSENPQEDPHIILKNVLATQYEVSELDLAKEDMDEINPLYKSLILIAQNGRKFEDRETGMLKKYVLSGGKLIVLADGVRVNEDLTTGLPEHGLFPLLKEWGLQLNNDLILSPSAEFVNFGNTSYQFLTPYPFWLKTNNFNKKTEYFANVAALTFPWTSSLTIDSKKSTLLVASPTQAWAQKNEYQLYPQEIKEPAENELKTFPLIASSKTKQGGVAVLIPSSRFLDARYLGKGAGNIEFIFNLVNNLASGGALSGIRSRSVNIYPLPTMPESRKDMVKYLNILLLPGLFAAYGAWRLIKRR